MLESLFDAGFYLEATYPIRSDETKGEAQLWLQEDRIRHHPRLPEARRRPSPISWARLRRKIADDMLQLKDVLKQHQQDGLPKPILKGYQARQGARILLQALRQGLCRAWPGFTLREALSGIHQFIRRQHTDERRSASAAEAFSRQFLRSFQLHRRRAARPDDEVPARHRHRPDDFEKRVGARRRRRSSVGRTAGMGASAVQGPKPQGHVPRPRPGAVPHRCLLSRQRHSRRWTRSTARTSVTIRLFPTCLNGSPATAPTAPKCGGCPRAKQLYQDWMEHKKQAGRRCSNSISSEREHEHRPLEIDRLATPGHLRALGRARARPSWARWPSLQLAAVFRWDAKAGRRAIDHYTGIRDRALVVAGLEAAHWMRWNRTKPSRWMESSLLAAIREFQAEVCRAAGGRGAHLLDGEPRRFEYRQAGWIRYWLDASWPSRSGDSVQPLHVERSATRQQRIVPVKGDGAPIIGFTSSQRIS